MIFAIPSETLIFYANIGWCTCYLWFLPFAFLLKKLCHRRFSLVWALQLVSGQRLLLPKRPEHIWWAMVWHIEEHFRQLSDVVSVVGPEGDSPRTTDRWSHTVTTAFNISRCQDVGDLHHGPSFVDLISKPAPEKQLIRAIEADAAHPVCVRAHPLVIGEELNGRQTPAIWTNTFWNLDKYFLPFGQIHFAI